MTSNRKYEAPRLEEVGSLAELTQAVNLSTNADGVVYTIPPGIVPGNTLLGTTSH